jgi:hypothetical protein
MVADILPLPSGAIAIMYSCLHFKRKENAPSYTALQLSLPLLLFKKKERQKGAIFVPFPSFPPVLPSLLTFSENPVTPSFITFFRRRKSAASVVD